MKEGWTYKKLGEFCEVISGQSPEGRYYNDNGEGTPFYQGKKDFTVKYIGEPSVWTTEITKIAEKDDLLMSVRAPVGDVNFATQTICIGRGLAAIRSKGSVDKQYLFYYLLANKKNIIGKEGVGFASINRKEIMDIEIHYPDSLPEQLSIVSHLDAAFAAIDALKANAEKQLAEARKLFQAELTECMRPKEGWEEKTLKEITTKIGSGATPKGGKKVYINDGTSLVRSLNVHNAVFKYKDLAHINQKAAEQLNGVELKSNDVLFNITGASIARCCVLPDSILPARVNQHVSILRPQTDIVLPMFLCLGLLSSDHQNILLSIGMAGSTRQAVTKADLEAHVFPIPSISIQQQIVSRLDTLSANVRRLEAVQRKTLTECDALKQAMLREVFE